MDIEEILANALIRINAMSGQNTKLIVADQEYTIEEALTNRRFELMDAFNSVVHFGEYELNIDGPTFIYINLEDLGIMTSSDFPGVGAQYAAKYRALGRNLSSRIKIERLLEVIFNTVKRIDYSDE